MNLLVDLGNSRLKWAQQGDGLGPMEAVLLGDNEPMAPILSRLWRQAAVPLKVVVCSVSAPQRLQELDQWVRERWSVTPHVVWARADQLGVKNCYREPEQLGADRWAALLAVRGLTATAACVVDYGTAVTVDALSAQGEFLGGMIFPGLQLLRRSLTQGTHGIKVSAGDAVDCQARSTADGVSAGTLLGLAGAVDRLIAEYRQTLGQTMQVFLTGGDAPWLAARLQSASTSIPDLVLQGLARIATTL
ncbi:MAG: type III pantothenate kinase [Sulfuricaulis sp.]